MNLQESIRRILREETEYVKDVRVKISDILKTNRDGQSLDDAIVNVQDGLKSYSEGPPFLLKIGDKYEVLDGFHRIAQKILDGKKYIISDVMIKESNMNLQESIRRILREELSPRLRRRIPYDEMEKEFLESFEFAYDLTKKRKVFSTHFLDELIYSTITTMMDGFHWRFVSTLPEDEFWYDDIHKELENHYRDRIIQMYNERWGIKESILKEESNIPRVILRRVTIDELDKIFERSLDENTEDYENPLAIMYGQPYKVFAKFVIDIMISELEGNFDIPYINDEDEYIEKYRKPLLRHYAPIIKDRYMDITSNNVDESILREETKKSKVTYFNWSSLKNRPEYYDYPMVKAHFKYDSSEDEKEYGVSDIQQYGPGQYFCITLNCIEHYRDNIGYNGESYFTIPNDAVIAVSNDDEIIYKDKSIRKKADGFYCPTYDTYGLVVWNTDKIKKIKKPAEANRNSTLDVLKVLGFK